MTMNFLRLFALAALAGGLASHTAMAQEQWACSQGNAVMNGVYVVTGGGTVTGVGPCFRHDDRERDFYHIESCSGHLRRKRRLQRLEDSR
jgi:hypothetical protein